MTSEPVPDSVSIEDLMRLLAKAPSDAENDEMPPLGTAVPCLPISAETSGILDLSIVMEQIIAASGGAPLIQVLQCLIYLSAGALDRLRDASTELAQMPGPHAAEAAAEMRRSTLLLARANSMITSVVAPATVGSVIIRCQEEGICVEQASHIPRRIYVSDALLLALGLDPAAFTAYLKRRAPITD